MPGRVPAWRRYLRFLRPDIDADVDDELAFHVEMRARDFEARGLHPAAAREAAVARFGDVETIGRWLRDHDRRRQRARHRRDTMGDIARDARFAARTLRRQPAFALTAVATLGLAIGACTAIFSVLEATLLQPLPFRAPERLAVLQGVAGPERDVRGGSVIEVLDWGRMSRSFEHVAIYDETTLGLQGDDGAERVEAEMVSASYFPMVGATAQLGRVFGPAEDSVPDAHPVVVISDAMWRTRFGADAGIVGRTVTLNERPFTVLGVMRPGFQGLSFDTDVWFPAMMVRANGGPSDLSDRGNRWLGAVGRLKDGVTLAQAQQDLDGVAAQLARDFPETNADRGVQLLALRDLYVGAEGGGLDSPRALVVALFGAVALLLLIACANVAGLQLVRAAGRRREIALRMAIGADRARLVRQLLTEGVVLAAAGALVGVFVAYWGLQGLVALAPDGVLPVYARPSLDATTFGFALAVAVGCGLVFGLVPAFRASRGSLSEALKAGGRGSDARLGSRRFGAQEMLVVGETALALVLLVGAGLFVRSLREQLRVDPGFRAEGIVRARFELPVRYTPEKRIPFVEELQTRLAAAPGVRAVAIGSEMPLGGYTAAGFLHVPEVDDRVRYYRHIVGPGYFSTLGIGVTRGRALDASDRDGAPDAAVISEAMAERFWKGADPVGRTFRLGSPTGPEVTVVGVVRDARFRDLTTSLSTTEPDVYFSIAQRPARGLEVAVRSDLDVAQVTALLRRELGALDPTIPLFAIAPLEEVLAGETAQGRFASTILSVFGAAALLLAAVGLYGVLAFLIDLRRREIGIRLALGATRERVTGGVIGRGLLLAAAGVAVGVAGAMGAMRVFENQLFSVGARDPVTIATVALALLVVSGLASLLPARRAARIDPQVALAAE